LQEFRSLLSGYETLRTFVRLTRAQVCSRVENRPAPPRRALLYRVHLHRGGGLVMGRNTSRQGNAHG